MKINIVPVSLLLLLAFGMSVQTTKPMGSKAFSIASKAYTGLCASAGLFSSAVLVFDATVLQTPEANKTHVPELQKQILSQRAQITQETHPKAFNVLKSMTDQHDIKDVIFTITPEKESQELNRDAWSANDYARQVSIGEDEVAFLEKNIDNKDISDQHKKFFNRNLGSIWHELGHIKRNSLMKKQAAWEYMSLASIPAIVYAITKVMPKKSYWPFLTKSLCGVSPIIALTATLPLQFAYGQYDEYKADDSIPATKELLEAQAENYERRHQRFNPVNNESLKGIMDRYPKLYYLTSINQSHPPDILRAQRFRNRLKGLKSSDAALESLNNQSKING